MFLVDRLSFFLVYQKLIGCLNLGDLVDSLVLVDRLLYLVTAIIVSTSMYPPHSGAIGLSNYKQPNLEHFLTSATLSFSLPLFL